LRSQVEKSVAQSMSISEQATRVLDSGSGQAGTSTRALLGTYAYMSPEQKRGEDVDARSDLYAVGLMAYQMLTGMESLGLKAPSRLNPEIDQGWDLWIEKATEPNPMERFESAETMLAELPVGVPPSGGLKAVARGEGGAAKTGTPTHPGRFWKTVWLMVFLGLLGFGAWQGYDYWEVHREAKKQEALQQAEERRLLAEQEALRQAQQEEAERREAEKQERLSQGRAEVQEFIAAGDLSRAQETLSALEAEGFVLQDLRLKLQTEVSARLTHARRGQAEVVLERWNQVETEDVEGLDSLMGELESVWQDAEGSRISEDWSEARSGYDQILGLGLRLEELANKRDQAREMRAELKQAREEATGLEAVRRATREWERGVNLEEEGARLYAEGNFTEAREKWEESAEKFGQAHNRAGSVMAWEEAKAGWEEAVDKEDYAMLEEWAPEKWSAAQAKAMEGKRSQEEPDAGKVAYETAVGLLATAIKEAEVALQKYNREKWPSQGVVDFSTAQSLIGNLRMEDGWLLYPIYLEYSKGDTVSRPEQSWVAVRLLDIGENWILEVLASNEGIWLPGDRRASYDRFYVYGLAWINYKFKKQQQDSLDTTILDSLSERIQGTPFSMRQNTFLLSQDVSYKKSSGNIIRASPTSSTNPVSITISMTFGGVGVMVADKNTMEPMGFSGGTSFRFNAGRPWIYFQPEGKSGNAEYPFPDNKESLQDLVRQAALAIVTVDGISSTQARRLKEEFLAAFPHEDGLVNAQRLYQIVEVKLKAREIISERRGRLNQHLRNDLDYPPQIITGGP